MSHVRRLAHDTGVSLDNAPRVQVPLMMNAADVTLMRLAERLAALYERVLERSRR
jgi:hypothetical protein